MRLWRFAGLSSARNGASWRRRRGRESQADYKGIQGFRGFNRGPSVGVTCVVLRMELFVVGLLVPGDVRVYATVVKLRRRVLERLSES